MYAVNCVSYLKGLVGFSRCKIMSNDQAIVLGKILKNVYTLSPRRKGRSVVWNILCDIIKDDGVILDGYLYCRNCKNLVKFSPKNTSNLNRHKCCQSLKEPQCLKTVTAEDKKNAIDSCVAWIIEDCQPFSAINGPGFQKLAKFFVNIGAKYGENIDMKDFLPDAKTLSRTTQKLADEKKKEVKDEIARVVHSGGAAATIDLWTDNYVRRNFLGVTLHYEKELKLYDIVLGMKSMDFQRSTGANILNKLSTLFCEFGITNIEKIKFVTDRGSNVVKALENNIRINCSSHLFANVLELSFKETTELTELVEACKKIVKYFKKANLQHHLQTSLKNECPTRWNSNFTMFKSIVDNWFHINEILKEKEESQRLLLISISTLKQLVDLCSDFEIIFKKMQLSNYPSLCYVLPSIKKIKCLCMPKDTDVSSIITLKENIINNIDKIWIASLSLWQKTAFFLYPPAWNIQQANLSDVKNFCISQIDKLHLISSTSSSVNSTPPSPCTPYSDSVSQFSFPDGSVSIDVDEIPANQSAFKDVNFFSPELIKNSTFTTAKTPTEEVDRYCKEKVEITHNFDVLKWWKMNEKSYPQLSKLALQVHSIPASSAAAERSFSLAGNIITEKRNRLGPKSVDSLLFLHSYFKNFNM